MEKNEDRKNYNQFFFNNLSAKEYFNIGVIEDEKLAKARQILKVCNIGTQFCITLQYYRRL